MKRNTSSSFAGRGIAHLAVSSALGLVYSSGALGQTAAPPPAGPVPTSQLEEIVVTASKRASTIQETPLSISAVSGQDILDRGITDFNSIAATTPGVSLKSSGPGQTEFELRGLTSSGGSSPTVGFY